MFDFGFGELLMVGVVALIVLGPERLPKVARAAGRFLGKVQYFVSSVKTELNREIDTSEFRDVKREMEEAAGGLRDSLKDIGSSMKPDTRPAWERVPEQRTPADFGLDETGKPLGDVELPASVATGSDAEHFDAEDYGSDYAVHPVAPAVSLKRRAIMQKRDTRPKNRIKPRLRAKGR